MRGGFRHRLRGSEDVLYGLIVKMPAPATLELAAYTGFDFALIDTEHGLADGRELEHHLRAADAAGLDCLVRVGGYRGAEVLRALDSGAAGVVVPHVRSAVEAGAAVRSAHYPPVGNRGLATSTRAGKHGTALLSEHVAAAFESTVVIAQVEDGGALEHVVSIASTPNLDGVFIGPTDLSVSLGLPGEFDHPRVLEAIDRCTTGVRHADNAKLCALAGSVSEADEWKRRGARVIFFGAASLLAETLESLVAALHASTTETIA
jgi:4-hydroxy-2-oxoheptanedioate aldolase